jgi:hypothetical protein
VTENAATRKSAVGEKSFTKKRAGTSKMAENVSVKTEIAIDRKFGNVVLTEPIKKHNDTHKKRIKP